MAFSQTRFFCWSSWGDAPGYGEKGLWPNVGHAVRDVFSAGSKLPKEWSHEVSLCGEYGLQPNALLLFEVPGALPQATVKKAFGQNVGHAVHDFFSFGCEARYDLRAAIFLVASQADEMSCTA